MDIPALQRALVEQQLDGWLLYDFHGQNPTALTALGLGGRMLTRRWYYLVPARGEPQLLVHAIELGSFPKEVPGRRRGYASWQSLHAALGELLGALPPDPRLAMEYFPEAAIPYLSRVDAGTLELRPRPRRRVVSSAELVQHFLCRWSDAQVESHRRALQPSSTRPRTPPSPGSASCSGSGRSRARPRSSASSPTASPRPASSTTTPPSWP